MGKKKPFVDRKSAATFQVVHRSQRDPLIAGAEDVGERVLVPLSGDKRIELQRRFGIEYEDNYDYLQHLRDSNEVVDVEVTERFRIEHGRMVPIGGGAAGPSGSSGPKHQLQLSSKLFATEGVEFRTGLLNTAAGDGPPQDHDPEIAAALDGHFDFDDPENELEDNFFELADGAVDSDDDDGEEGDAAMQYRHKPDDYETDTDSEASSDDDASGEGDRLSEAGDSLDDLANIGSQSRFTNYSLTSSVMRRSDGLQLCDARFEKLYEEYDEERLGEGPLEPDPDAAGLEPNSDQVQALVQEFDREKQAMKTQTADIVNDKSANALVPREDEMDDNEAPDSHIVVEDKHAQRRWDCESVLSTYSTLYNHPRLIADDPASKKRKVERIRLDAKGLPVGVVNERLTTQKLRRLDADAMDCESVASKASTVRPANESAEQRRQRKAAVKAERRERRAEKKANAMAFRSEFQQRARELASADRKAVKLV